MIESTNRLATSASPYLRQHAHQPVAWRPWSEEAFAEARERDVPVLVSIGYAACHWCHVMAHESFDDPDVAKVMNEHFVNVKVDREERPDVDAVYMSAVQALTGSGGWPMTVVTTPDGRPWFAGTYFPPDDRHGLPGFRRVLDALRATWSERRDEVSRSAEQITAHLSHVSMGPEGPTLTSAAPAIALSALRRGFDSAHGGFGGAPKFPPHTTLRFLMEAPTGADAAEGEPAADDMLRLTLRGMTDGGIHDQLLGGFARYSVDAAWLVPHFEKMLYDNALLLPILARSGARFGDERLTEAAEGVLGWALDTMRLDGVTFAASQDADSEGEEGRFATFTPRDLEAALSGPDEIALARALYGIDEVGQVEGRSVPVFRALEHPAVRSALAEAGADAAGADADETAARVERVRAALVAHRLEREPPATDDKVVTSWNALMVRGLVEAAPWLPSGLAERARDAAVACADALWERAWDGTCLRHLAPPGSREERRPTAPAAAALLEDAASYALASLALYRAGAEPRFLSRALTLADAIERDFSDGAGGFYTTPAFGEELVVRPRSTLDGPTPSEYGLTAELFAWVASWTGDEEAAARARGLLRGIGELAERAPTAVASLLSARERLESAPVEVLVAGPGEDPTTSELLACADRLAPDYAVVGRVPPPLVADGGASESAALAAAAALDRVPWFAGRVADRPTAYVCYAGTCRVPVHGSEALAEQLVAARRSSGAAQRP